jgi:hypothetical protein
MMAKEACTPQTICPERRALVMVFQLAARGEATCAFLPLLPLLPSLCTIPSECYINLVLDKWLETYVTRGSAGLHDRGEHLLRCPPEEDGQVGTKVGGNRERNLYSCGELCVVAICCSLCALDGRRAISCLHGTPLLTVSGPGQSLKK